MTRTDLQLLSQARGRVVQLLRTHDRSAKEIARALGIQVSAARKHLERLREMGVVTQEFRRQPRGRPSKRYALTEEGKEIFPRRYDAVLDSLLSALVEERGGEYVESVLQRVARESARGARTRSPRDRLRALLALLNDLGFEANAKRGDGTVLITSRNCPILRVAAKHRELVCRGLHAALIEAALDGEVERKRWILDGEPVCTHLFRRGKSEGRPGSGP